MHLIIQDQWVDVCIYVYGQIHTQIWQQMCVVNRRLAHNQSKTSSQHTLPLVESSVVSPAIESSRVYPIGKIADPTSRTE